MERPDNIPLQVWEGRKKGLLCPKCASVKTHKKWLGLRIPQTIPGLVYKGVCLKCVSLASAKLARTEPLSSSVVPTIAAPTGSGGLINVTTSEDSSVVSELTIDFSRNTITDGDGTSSGQAELSPLKTLEEEREEENMQIAPQEIVEEEWGEIEKWGEIEDDEVPARPIFGSGNVQADAKDSAPPQQDHPVKGGGAHLEPTLPWWKHRRAKRLLCICVGTAAALAYNIWGRLSTNEFPAGGSTPPPMALQPWGVLSTNEFPAGGSTPPPMALQSWGVSCADTMSSNKQKLDLPNDVSFSSVVLDGKHLVVLAHLLPRGNRIIFHSFANGEWQRTNTFREEEGYYSFALSGSTAFLGTEWRRPKWQLSKWSLKQSAGDVTVYEQNELGLWDKVEDPFVHDSNADHDGFGSSVAIDGNLACVGDSTSLYLYRRDGAKWMEFDKIIGPTHCVISGDTIVTVKEDPDHFHLDPEVAATLQPHKYKGTDGMVPIQEPIIAKTSVSSVVLSGVHLGYFDHEEDAVVIYRREKENQTFTFHQQLKGYEGFGLALWRDTLVVGGDQTHIFTDMGRGGYWEEVITLNEPYGDYQLSGSNLLVSGENGVHSFDINSCMHDTPSQPPSLTLVPTKQPATCSQVNITLEVDSTTMDLSFMPYGKKWELRRLDIPGGNFDQVGSFWAESWDEWDRYGYPPTICLPEGAYEFTIHDKWGGFVWMYHVMTSAGELIAQGGQFLGKEKTRFSIPLHTCNLDSDCEGPLICEAPVIKVQECTPKVMLEVDIDVKKYCRYPFSLVEMGVEEFPLGLCEGQCNRDGDCQGSLECFLRLGTEVVPGCVGNGTLGSGYCAERPNNYLWIKAENGAKLSAFPLGVCEGACSSDVECEGNLICKERSGDEVVPGCDGPGRSGANYCRLPDLVDKGSPAEAFPLGLCQGNCVNDDECADGLLCFHRTSTQDVVGCSGSGTPNWNYCAERPTNTTLFLRGNGGSPATNFPLKNCEGNCESDDECDGALVCFQRSRTQEVPGCKGLGASGQNYCYSASGNSAWDDMFSFDDEMYVSPWDDEVDEIYVSPWDDEPIDLTLIEGPEVDVDTGDDLVLVVDDFEFIGTWLALKIYDASSDELVDIVPGSSIFVEFWGDEFIGSFAGIAGCNEYKGGYTDPNHTSFTIKGPLDTTPLYPLDTTPLHCEGKDITDQGNAYIGLLTGTLGWSTSDSLGNGMQLELTDAQGRVLVQYVSFAGEDFCDVCPQCPCEDEPV